MLILLIVRASCVQIVKNAEGKSKGYGFVEFTHKDEAQKAKLVGGKTPSDGGKFIRVEPGDAYQINEMFSLSLFVDHLPRDLPNVSDEHPSLVLGHFWGVL